MMFYKQYEGEDMSVLKVFRKRLLLKIFTLLMTLMPMLIFAEPIVKTVDELPLVRWETGQEAMNEIHQLHRMKIDIDEGLVAQYQGHTGNKEVIIWASKSKTETEAEKLLQLMVDRMPNSRIFMKMATKSIGSVLMQYVFGMGMDHYYYQQGKWVFWVASKGLDLDKAMLEVLLKFKVYQYE